MVLLTKLTTGRKFLHSGRIDARTVTVALLLFTLFAVYRYAALNGASPPPEAISETTVHGQLSGDSTVDTHSQTLPASDRPTAAVLKATSQASSVPHKQSKVWYGKVMHKPNFVGSDLRFLDARHAHMFRADFSRTNMQRADLQSAFLGEAIFDGALLVNTNFRFANLRAAHAFDADLSFSDLSNTVLVDAVLSGSILHEVKLSWSNMTGAQLEYANLYGADLRNTWLSGANLRGAVFAGAHLQNTNFNHAELGQADFTGANLSGADLRFTNITQAQLVLACGDATTQYPEGFGDYRMIACQN